MNRASARCVAAITSAVTRYGVSSGTRLAHAESASPMLTQTSV